MTAPMEPEDGASARSPSWQLLLPVALIAAAAILTPASELHSNQGDVGLYLEKARAFATGQVPYRDFPFEYPPLALIPMVVPYLAWPFGTVDLAAYHWLFAAWEAALMLALAVVLARLVRLGGDGNTGPSRDGSAEPATVAARLRAVAIRLAIVTFGAALALTWRFDLYPALLVMVALWAALDGRPGAAGVAVGLGVLAKLYPLALVPSLAIPWLLPMDPRRLTRFALAVGLTVVLGISPFLALAGGDALAFLRYQGERGLQVESIGGGLAVLGGLLAGRPVPMSYGFSAVQVEGPFAAAWLAVLPLATVAAFAILGWLGWRRIRADRGALGEVPARTVVALTTASILVLLATSKVFSIQYVVWIVPFAALLPRRRFWLAAGMIALTMPIHPLLYRELVDQEALPILVLNVRNGLLVALLAWQVCDIARGESREMARPAGLEPTTFRSAT